MLWDVVKSLVGAHGVFHGILPELFRKKLRKYETSTMIASNPSENLNLNFSNTSTDCYRKLICRHIETSLMACFILQEIIQNILRNLICLIVPQPVQGSAGNVLTSAMSLSRQNYLNKIQNSYCLSKTSWTTVQSSSLDAQWIKYWSMIIGYYEGKSIIIRNVSINFSSIQIGNLR
jgi:hypothetical protein